MEVVLTTHPGDTHCVVLNVFWQGRVIHAEAFTRTRAASVAQLFAEDGYLVTWKPRPHVHPTRCTECHGLNDKQA
ncbi:hypothetical protein [Anthocerotibacter panamensis]|uniref:hypothetical protein n=1 Tax=Anthocerotibacter panamensis TaxID=2857077 RepID=UPI001C40188B|nr:hypothetical protein [Anthocerotibacter panamensis]